MTCHVPIYVLVYNLKNQVTWSVHAYFLHLCFIYAKRTIRNEDIHAHFYGVHLAFNQISEFGFGACYPPVKGIYLCGVAMQYHHILGNASRGGIPNAHRHLYHHPLIIVDAIWDDTAVVA